MEKSLLAQLNKLKCIQPDKEWKEVNRAILYNQISASSERINLLEPAWVVTYHRLARFFAQPAFVVFAVIVAVAGVFSFMATRNTIPGDSLYIAKVISERAQLAITFDQNKKDIMTIKFASNHAKDITRVLANPEFNHEDTAQKERLTSDFKKEIDSVKEKLAGLNLNNEEVPAVEEDSLVHSADFKKDEQGIEVSPSTSTITAEEAQTETKNTESDSSEANRVLEEAEVLFSANNYEGALDKLEEADLIISGNSPEADQIAPASEAASEQPAVTEN